VSNTKKNCRLHVQRIWKGELKPRVLCNKLNLTFYEIALSLGADYGYRSLLQEKWNEWMASQYINYLLVLITIRINPTSFQLSQNNSYHCFLLGIDQTRSAWNCCENGISYRKKDSQGLCFIGKVRLPNFATKIRAKEGAIIQIDKDHSIYSVENKKSCLQNQLVLRSKKLHTVLGLSWKASGCPLLYHWTKERSERRRNNWAFIYCNKCGDKHHLYRVGK
jgi:hypothetical protein